MARKVLLPRELNRKLDNLTELVEEVNGILLYRRQGDYCPLEYLFLTGVGTEEHVQSFPERIEVANEFFRRNPHYKLVKFHTHSKGTIESFGQSYARHFSPGDIDGIREQLKSDKEFMALLATPETKLLWGLGNLQLIAVDNFFGYKERERAINQSMNIIARGLGYDLGRLSAHR